MRVLLAIWLPITFTVVCIGLVGISYFFVVPSFFGVADTLSRYREYRKLRNRKISKALLNVMRVSNCQRNVCKAISDEATLYYKQLGYRWYHVLPDGSFTISSNPYLSVKFYKQLLGVK